jgi:hypothetical protein
MNLTSIKTKVKANKMVDEETLKKIKTKVE